MVVTGYSRQRPWPYDAELAGEGVLLAPREDGQMVARKAETFEKVAPPEYSYANLPAYAERPYLLRVWGGYGERVQTGERAATYYHADGVDTSLGFLILAPEFSTWTPPSTGEIRAPAVQALDAGTLKNFVAAGRYVLKQNGDASADFVVSKDFGAGRTVQSLVRFKGTAGGVDGLYAALDNGEFWQYDGTTWNAGPALEGSGEAFKAYHLFVFKDELVRAAGADGNVVRRVTGNPLAAGDWTGPIYVGELSAEITGFGAVDEALIVFTEIGPFSWTVSGATVTVHELFPEMRARRSVKNGRNARSWLGYLWFRHGDGFYRMRIAGEVADLEPIGPWQLLRNDSAVRGTVEAFVGHASWFGYYGVYNPSNGNSYLVKHGTWLNPETTDERQWRFVDGYHGALATFAGKQITSMAITDLPGANERLEVGFSDGSIAYCTLPRGTPNPTADASCRFAASGRLYWSDHHAMFQAGTKAWRGISVYGPKITATETVEHEYRTNLDAAFAAFVAAWTSNGQRQDFPEGTASKVIGIVTELSATTRAATPIVEGVVLHESYRPDLVLEYGMTIDARPYRARHDGVVDHRSGDQIRNHAKTAAAAAGSVTLRLPYEELKAVTVLQYAERYAAPGQRYGAGWLVDLTAIEFKSYEEFGTHGRLEAYTHGQLEAYTHAQLETL